MFNKSTRNVIHNTYVTRELRSSTGGRIHVSRLTGVRPVITRADGTRETITRDDAAAILRIYR